MIASDGVVVPMIPDKLSFNAAEKVHERIGVMQKRMRMKLKFLGVFANRVANPKPQSVTYYLQEAKDTFGELFFKTQVDQTVKISDAIAMQEKVSEYAGKDSKAARQLKALANEIIKRMEANNG